MAADYDQDFVPDQKNPDHKDDYDDDDHNDDKGRCQKKREIVGIFP